MRRSRKLSLEENFRIAGIDLHFTGRTITSLLEELLHRRVARICRRKEPGSGTLRFDGIEEPGSDALATVPRGTSDQPDERQREELVVPNDEPEDRARRGNEHSTARNLSA
ncbi:MAG: hypothetical protein NVS1B14_03180 [Vulcanimicrobiaceae bacterium]